ncbi:hypothetical protein Bca101_066295 [Brassica carinata]
MAKQPLFFVVIDDLRLHQSRCGSYRSLSPFSLRWLFRFRRYLYMSADSLFDTLRLLAVNKYRMEKGLLSLFQACSMLQRSLKESMLWHIANIKRLLLYIKYFLRAFNLCV